MLGKPRIRLNNRKTSLRFPCLGLNPIIDSISLCSFPKPYLKYLCVIYKMAKSVTNSVETFHYINIFEKKIGKGAKPSHQHARYFIHVPVILAAVQESE